MKKGFISIITATLAVMLLLFLVGVVFSMRGVQETGTADLAAKIASDHFTDSKAFYNASIHDAALDAAYSTRQCGLGNNFCTALSTKLRQYLTKSFTDLSSPPLLSNYSSPFSETCLGPVVVPIAGENMDEYTISVPLLVDVNNSQAEYRRQSLAVGLKLYSYYSSAVPRFHRFRLRDSSGNEFYNLKFECP